MAKDKLLVRIWGVRSFLQRLLPLTKGMMQMA